MKLKSGIEAEVDSGGKFGEFTVWVDDILVAKKGFLRFPKKEKILAAVQQHIQ